MAYTKIHAIKATVNKAIAYICNDEKTDGQLLVTTFGTSIATASADFDYALCKTKSSDPNKAFHLVQSFVPGEVSFDECHKIGIELADKLLEGKYNYVVATHVDKGHCHNHIIFCAADNIEHKKYHDCKKSYYHIRELSDELCKEHHLSVIIPRAEKGKNYNEWLADKNSISWKTQLRHDIDDAIKIAKSYDNFIELIKAKGYEVKGEDFGEGSAKYISFKPMSSGSFIRGRQKSLGTEYTKERIKERIEDYQKQKNQEKVPFPHKKRRTLNQDYAKKNLIDISSEKFQNSPGLQKWANVQNLKIAASIYSQTDSLSDLQEQLEQKAEIIKESKSTVVSIEHKMRELGEILKYAKQYNDNEPYNYRYHKSKNPDHYLRTHETQLILFDGAKDMLKRYGINPKSINIEKLQNEFSAYAQKKADLQKIYKSAEKDSIRIQKQIDNFREYIRTVNNIPSKMHHFDRSTI